MSASTPRYTRAARSHLPALLCGMAELLRAAKASSLSRPRTRSMSAINAGNRSDAASEKPRTHIQYASELRSTSTAGSSAPSSAAPRAVPALARRLHSV